MLLFSFNTLSNRCSSSSELSFALHNPAYKDENEEIKSFWKVLCSVSAHQQPELRSMNDSNAMRSTRNVGKVTRARINKKRG